MALASANLQLRNNDQVALSPERLSALRATKLVALCRAVGELGAYETMSYGPGAALVSGAAGWVLAEPASVRSLGPALVWAVRHQLKSLTLFVDSSDPEVTGSLARQSQRFSLDIQVRTVRLATSELAAPQPHRWDPPPAPMVPEVVEAVHSAGAEVIIEHGIAKVEYLGCEIGRMVSADGGEPHLEIGVGKFDREISAMMHSALNDSQAVQRVVSMVSRYRRIGAPTHPLRDLASQRWLRHIVCQAPELVGAETLAPVDATVYVDTLREHVPACALGRGSHGEPITVVCSTTADLDTPTCGADTWHEHGAHGELVFVRPGRMAIEAIDAVCRRINAPVRFVDVELPV